jgi:hypothetical protein
VQCIYKKHLQEEISAVEDFFAVAFDRVDVVHDEIVAE